MMRSHSAAPRQTEATPDILSRLAENAEAEDAGTRSIAESMALLRRAGWLEDDGLSDPETTATRLMRVASANLSAARLFEGHVNALALVRVHGFAALRRDLQQALGQGALLGVWGADAEPPVRLDSASGRLTGAKRFASGLGVASHAVVSVQASGGVRLALVPADDPQRADKSTWQMPGMKATDSGTYDFTGLEVPRGHWIGGPDDYFQEPHFFGGVWRIAAVQLGGAAGLIETAASGLRARDRLKAPAQTARLGGMQRRIIGAAALVHRAAPATGRSPEEHACLSIAARLLTEEVALDAIRAAEQSLGMAHFAPGSASGRQARDLAVYLRQAAADALAQRVAEHTVGREGAIWSLLQ